MIAIIDYGVGNIFSIKRSLDYLGFTSVLTEDPKTLAISERIILPGVGAFSDAKEKLDSSGMVEPLLAEIKKGKPTLGICLGMQLLFEKSLEYGETEGLSLIPGYVEDMKKLICDKSLNIPQMGWNKLDFPKDKEKSPLFKYIKEGDSVYFVHSYSAVDCEDYLIASTDYSYPVTAAVAKDNLYGVQFHPEKSGEVGLNILKAFGEL